MLDITKLKCKKCNHSWYPMDRDKDPLACPRCKRYDWNVEDKKVEKNGK